MYPFSAFILNLPVFIIILFLAWKASLYDSILKVPSFIIIFPKLTVSSSSGDDFIPSPVSVFIVNIPPLKVNKPSEEIPFWYPIPIYSPF